MDSLNYSDIIFNQSRSIAKAVHKKLYFEFRKHGLYPGQPELLYLIKCNDGIIQKELSSLHSSNESTITIMLKKMEQCGYIKREVNAKDKRALEVHLTDKGIEIINICEKCVEKIREELFKGFSEEEYNQMLELIKKFEKNIGL